MIKIALIEGDERVIGLIRENLEKEFAAETSIFTSYLDFTQKGGLNLPFVLIICRSMIEEEESAKCILNLLYDSGKEMKVIVLGDIEQSSFQFSSLPARFRLPELDRLIISVLGLTRDQLAEFKLPDFIPIPLSHFYLMNSVPCDIYIRLERKGVPDKYVKRLHSADSFDKDAIKRYEANNLKSFYVEKANRHLFMNSLVQQSLDRVDHVFDLSQAVEALGDAFSITSDLVRNTGLDTHSSQFIDGTVGQMGKVIADNPTFATLFSHLVRANGAVAYRHSYLIMLFGHKVIPLLDWIGRDHIDEMTNLFMYVAFFHDVFLDSPELLPINSKSQLQSLALSEHQRDLVLNHANLAATLSQKLPHAPSGIDIIVRQHHGTLNGVGFPEVYSAGISKLAIVFIVVEKFVWRLIQFDKNKETLAVIFDQLSLEFPLPSYRSVVERLKQVVLTK